MKIQVGIFPPNSHRQEFVVTLDLPSIPREGDKLVLMREGASGTEDFIVRGPAHWNLKISDDGKAVHFGDGAPVGRLMSDEIWLRAEPEIGPYSSDDHKKFCQQVGAGG